MQFVLNSFFNNNYLFEVLLLNKDRGNEFKKSTFKKIVKK